MKKVILTFLKKLPQRNKNEVQFSISKEELERLKSLPRYSPTETNFYGNKFVIVDAPTFISSYSEIFEQEIYKFNTIDSNPIIIDCGANIGLATIYFKRNFPSARILSYEADPKIFEVLKENLISFGCNDVQVFNAAVSDMEGINNFKIEGGHSGMITDEGVAENIVPVKTIRLKKVLENLEQITFLKIDIEGHETYVVPDIAKELRKVKFLFLEYHSFIDKEQQLDQMLSLVKEAGFKYYIKESANKQYPFIQRELFLKMDLLVNIFCYRD